MFKQWDPLLQWRRGIYFIQFNTRKKRKKTGPTESKDSRMVSAASQVFRMRSRFVSLFIEKTQKPTKKNPRKKPPVPTLKHSKFNGQISFFLIMDNDYPGSVSSLHFVLRKSQTNVSELVHIFRIRTSSILYIFLNINCILLNKDQYILPNTEFL